MARQLEDALELERENEGLRSILYATKIELNRIQREYLETCVVLNERDVNEMGDAIEALSLTVENALF
jgi:hypothetical protein